MSKKRKTGLWLVLLALSVSVLAGVGAYKGAHLLADEITTDAEKQAEKAGLFKPEGVESDMTAKILNGEKTAEKLRPVSLIYSVNYENGKIEKIAVEIFDTVSMKASFVYFDPEITYTMTGTLYRSLANGNVLVPQTVTLSELYSYYGNASSFEAGRKIMSELLGLEIDHYSAFSKENIPEDFLVERVTALGLKELFEKKEGKETDLTHEQEASYRELVSYMSDEDVKVSEAPVIKRNESCFADVTGLWEILRDLVPEDERNIS